MIWLFHILRIRKAIIPPSVTTIHLDIMCHASNQQRKERRKKRKKKAAVKGCKCDPLQLC